MGRAASKSGWRHRLAVAVGAGLLLGGPAACSLGGPGPLPLTRIGTGPKPLGIAVGGGSVWVANSDSTVTRINAATGQVMGAPIKVPGHLSGIAYGFGAVWIADDAVRRMDSRSGRLVGAPVKAVAPNGVTVGAGAVWAWASHTLVRISGRTGKMIGRPIKVRFELDEVQVAGGVVWALDTALDSSNDSLFQLDARTGALLAPPIKVDLAGIMAVGQGSVWVTRSAGNAATVIRIDPRTGHTIGSPVRTSGPSPGGIAIGAGSVWISNTAYGYGSVTQINARTGQVVRGKIELGSEASGDAVAVGQGSVWVADSMANALTRIRIKSQ